MSWGSSTWIRCNVDNRNLSRKQSLSNCCHSGSTKVEVCEGLNWLWKMKWRRIMNYGSNIFRFFNSMYNLYFFMKTKFRLCCSFQFPWNLQWMKARLLCTNLMAVAYSRAISFDLSGDSFAGSRPLRLQLSPLRLQQMLLQLQLQLQLLPHRTETHLSPVTCCRLKWSLLLPKVQIEVITQTDCLYTQKNISININ